MSPFGYVSAVYFANWSIYDAKHFVDDLPADHLTHVFYAFLKIDPDSGACSLSDPWADSECPMRGGSKGSLGMLINMKSEHRNLKTILSVGGWGTERSFQKMMRSQQTLNTFISTTMTIVKKYKFDGVDIDWEYPRTSDEAACLVYLLSELRVGLCRVTNPVILTAALPAGEENIRVLDIPKLSAQLTYMNIMCYDFCGAGWSKHTGFHSNLYGENGDNSLNSDSVIRSYINRGARPGQILMGMPTYGRSFPNPRKVSSGQKFQVKSGATEEILEYRQIDRSREYYYEQMAAASTYDKKRSIFVTYDNPACIASKAKYVSKYGLGGGFFWDSKGDTKDSALVRAFVEGLGHSLRYERNSI